MERFCKVLLVVLFLAVIYIPATGWLAGWQFDAELEEKRAPAPWPTPSDLKQNAAGAAKTFEDAFSDRFAFRNLLIKTDAWLNWCVFGITTTDNVVVGRDGWLFFTGNRSMPLFQGVDRFTDVDAAYVADVLEMRHRWLRDQGIASAHVLAPAKESVYPEFMPRGIPRVKQPSCMEEFINYGLSGKKEGQPVDLLSALSNAKARQHPLYLRGDSHWNDAGALIAYRQTLKRLGLEQSGLPDAALQSSIDPQTHPYRDLATMLGITDTYCRDWPNDSPVISPKTGWTFRLTGDPAQRMRQTTAVTPRIDRRLLFFGDSFSEALLPFFAETFASVTLYQGRFFSPSVVLEHKPQVVVVEAAERVFFHGRPAAAQEARVIHSAVWEKRILAASAGARVIFDSTQGWRDAVVKPKRAATQRGPVHLRISQDRAGIDVPVDLNAVAADSAVAVRLEMDLPHDGLLKWRFENKKGDVVAPSWIVHVELHAGKNDVCLGLPARGTAGIGHLNLSVQTGGSGGITVESLRVVEIPRQPAARAKSP